MSSNSNNSDAPKPHINSHLKNKICLVTGASRTLGREIALHLAATGADVAVNYCKSQQEAEALCRILREKHKVRAMPVQADVTEETGVDQLIAQVEEAMGPVDLLVNNVGPYVDTPLLELPLSDFDRIIDGNLRSVFLLSKYMGEIMKKRGRGSIINIAAADAFHRSHSVYSLAKAGVIHLTEAFALELAPEVRINAIAPDLIADNEHMPDGLVEKSIAGTPLNKLITRSDIAAMVVLLCGSAFANVTGQVIVMDGGRSIPRIANS